MTEAHRVRGAFCKFHPALFLGESARMALWDEGTRAELFNGISRAIDRRMCP